LAAYDQSITAQNATFSVVEGGTLSEPTGTLQTGATDTDTSASCCTVSADPTAPPASGSVTFDANGDGGFKYTPNSGFTGTDSFGFILTDTDGNTAGGTVTVDVNPVTVTASDATYVTTQGTKLPLPAGTLQINDSDDNPVSGASCCTATLTSAPSNGTVTVGSNGSFGYTPNSGFTGTDSFSYTLRDSDGNVSAPAEASVNVGPTVQGTITKILSENPEAASPSIPVTFVAQVSPKGHGPAPTGSVTFTWYRTGGKAGGGSLTGTIGTASLSEGAQGDTATITTKPGDLEAGVVDGSITITATYSGDSSNASSAAEIIYYVQATCDEGQWPSVSSGLPTLDSTGTPTGYYVGQSNGNFAVYVAGTANYQGYIKTNGLILNLSAIKDKKVDWFQLKGEHVIQFAVTDKGHLDGFGFYAGCGSKISFNLKMEGGKAPLDKIFLGNPTSNATKNPVVLTRSS
jgi:hypothetical protein